MNNDKKLFEVILAPSDRLEKELDDVLGGMGDDCIINKCGNNEGPCGFNYCKTNSKECPEGMVYDPATCSCVPIG